ncbi:MAG: hypothetical protein NTW30_04990 [Candidatus Aenigmarchaeota archaeon]|nr:hypothetical protein [Candidatus Aenigmarchaeota archaeon]
MKEILGDENDPQYGWRWVWKRKGPDHWCMSTIYARVGLDRFAEAFATIINAKDDFYDSAPVGRIFNINEDLE